MFLFRLLSDGVYIVWYVYYNALSLLFRRLLAIYTIWAVHIFPVLISVPILLYPTVILMLLRAPMEYIQIVCVEYRTLFSITLVLGSSVIFVMSGIAFFTLLERKVLSSIQRRRGPNIAGFFGLLQPFSDGLKLFLKELVYTSSANLFLFFVSPIFTFICTLLLWYIVPFSQGSFTVELPFALLVILCISSLSVHGIIIAGWASNSKFAFFGGLRSAAQMISYELCLSTVFLSIVSISGSFSLIEIVYAQRTIWYIFPLLPLFFILFICVLAETNRTPFDLPEAEAELVAGYNVEYSAIAFAIFFLAEYGNMMVMSSLISIFFFGGWNSIFFSPVIEFACKVCIIMFLFIWVRASLPRYRYDQLMDLGWRVLIPVSFFLFFLELSILKGLSFFL